MIRVCIPKDKKNFNYKECKKLYKKCQRQIQDDREFRELVESTFFFSFFDDDKFIGCIYYYYDDNKLFMNGFAHRHTFEINQKCMKMSYNWFKCDIYARPMHKASSICLLKSGFKKVSDSLYKLERY